MSVPGTGGAVLAQRQPGTAAATEWRRLARLQRWRRGLQLGFFALFLLAPALNLLRFDLTETQLWVLGQRWTLGIDALLQGRATATETALSILLRGVLPVLVLAVSSRSWSVSRRRPAASSTRLAAVAGLQPLSAATICCSMLALG